MTITAEQIARIEAAGFRTRERNGRVYLSCDGKDAGYITDADAAGSTGDCQNVTRRKGSVAAALRGSY